LLPPGSRRRPWLPVPASGPRCRRRASRAARRPRAFDHLLGLSSIALSSASSPAAWRRLRLLWCGATGRGWCRRRLSRCRGPPAVDFVHHPSAGVPSLGLTAGGRRSGRHPLSLPQHIVRAAIKRSDQSGVVAFLARPCSSRRALQLVAGAAVWRPGQCGRYRLAAAAPCRRASARLSARPLVLAEQPAAAAGRSGAPETASAVEPARRIPDVLDQPM
jgi:hypothetical protein